MSAANNSRNINSVFYAESYHPIQAGSIDGTDIAPHDNAIYRAFLCSSAGLYDPLGDPKLLGDPYCTVFVGRLSHLTTERSLRKAMSKYGRVTKLRLVRDIVTGASRGYAFVEFETDREMRRAYKEAHHTMVDDSEIIVDYSRQQLMPGWIPRRLGGGLGGRKESGQLRFGGRERPFRAPLRPIPYDDLKKLGIPPPPEGQYVSRFQVPSPPRRKGSSADREVSTRSSSAELEEHHDRWKPARGEHHQYRRDSAEREEARSKRSFRENLEHSDKRTSREGMDFHNDHSSVERERRHDKRSEDRRYRQDWSSVERERRHDKNGEDRVYSHDQSSVEREGHHNRSSHTHKEKSYKRAREDHSEYSDKRSSRQGEDDSRKHHKHERSSDKHKRRRLKSRDRYSDHS